MKKLYAIAIMLLVAAGAYAQEGRNIYNKYSDSNGVSAVYISPAMFKLIGRIPELTVSSSSGEETIDIAPLIRTFSGFYMLDISDPSVRSSLESDLKSMIDKGHYELLMEVKDSGDNLRMYTAGDEKTVESFVFMAHSDSDIQFICIDGAMSREEVNTLIAHLAQ